MDLKSIKQEKKHRDAFQIKVPEHVNPLDPKDKFWSDARIRGEFDTLQLFENGKFKGRHPRKFGDEKGQPLEPFTEAYPEYGKGGRQQIHGDLNTVKYDNVDILPEE